MEIARRLLRKHKAKQVINSYVTYFLGFRRWRRKRLNRNFINLAVKLTFRKERQKEGWLLLIKNIVRKSWYIIYPYS
jgi:hypothetical protein